MRHVPMLVVRAALTLVAVGVSFDAVACAVMTAPQQRAADREDRATQRELVATLAREATMIAIAKANAPVGDGSASFAVEQVLKGDATASLALRWDAAIVVGCRSSVMFRNVRIEPGETYLLYVADGVILRAGDVSRARGDNALSYREERHLVRRQVAPK